MSKLFKALQGALGAALVLQMWSTGVQAHVALAETTALAGSHYKAVLRIGHGCDGSSTTGLKVFMPAGFEGAEPQPKAGWSISLRPSRQSDPHNSHGKAVTEEAAEIQWTAASKSAALPGNETGEFVVTGRLTGKAGPVWIKVLQTCEKGRIEWFEVPPSGVSTQGLKSPAVLLNIKAATATGATVTVGDAWVRPTVTGQKATGVFLKLTAKEAARLVGVSSPVAGIAEIHEMKMDKDVMRMAPVPALELPAGKTVELKPGGLHLMLMDLKTTIQKGDRVPLVLTLQDAKGATSSQEVSVEAGMAMPVDTSTHRH